MSSINKLASELKSLINESDAKKPQPYDTDATVVRVEGDTLWVHIPGGVDETPIKRTINASVGDNIKVRIAGGSAWASGNSSAPPTDDKRANEAMFIAMDSQEAAQRAKNAADSATEDAARAKAAAEAVEGIAEEAREDAQRAEGYATEAKASAENASEYAARALGNLSTVQSVTETLNWITAHGTMTLTTDTALDPTHVYFVVDQNGDYEVGGTHYSVVTEPDVADISTYYELSIDESLNNYVGTHLAVTSEGLWLLPDADGNKVLIATGQGTTYTDAGTYIIGKMNGNDVVLAKFTSTNAVIGRDQGLAMVLSATGMDLTFMGTSYVALKTNGIVSGWTDVMIPQPTINNGESAVVEYLDNSVGNSRYDFPFDISYVMNGTEYRVRDCNSLIGEEVTDENGVTVKILPNSSGEHDADIIVENNTGNVITMSKYWAHGSSFPKESPSIRVGSGENIFGRSISVGGKNVSGYAYNSLFGYGLKAGNRAQMVIGTFNQQTSDRFIIGNGASDNNRSNALAVTWDGNVHIDLADYQTASTTDKAIYDALVALGWESEVTE